MIKYIIFDYDGVIVDSFPNEFNVYKKVYDHLGMPFPEDIEAFSKAYQYGARRLLESLGVIEQTDVDQVEAIYWHEIKKEQQKIYENIDNVLETLSKTFALILFTANYEDAVRKNLETHTIDHYFTHIEGKKDLNKFAKINAFKNFFEEHNVQPDEVISIGDRNIDHDIARELGIPHIILTSYGWGHDSSTLSPETAIVDTPLDILKVVSRLCR